jgi:hypothetical protein
MEISRDAGSIPAASIPNFRVALQSLANPGKTGVRPAHGQNVKLVPPLRVGAFVMVADVQ